MSNYILDFQKNEIQLHSDVNFNLSKVKNLLNIIGSPFNRQTLELEESESVELYDIARKNKIGLLFLETLAEKKKINNELQRELDKQREVQKTLLTTAERVELS